MIVSISQSQATRQFVREQEIETNKGLFTPQHREEKLLVIVTSVQASLANKNHCTGVTLSLWFGDKSQ